MHIVQWKSFFFFYCQNPQSFFIKNVSLIPGSVAYTEKSICLSNSPTLFTKMVSPKRLFFAIPQ